MPASFEIRCLRLGVGRHLESAFTVIFAVSLPPWLDVVSSKHISLCGFPINTSQGELVNMDEAF